MINLEADAQRGLLSFRTGVGLDFLHGRCGIDTNRGLSRPDKSLRLGLRHEFHQRRLTSRAVEFWHTLRNERAEGVRITQIKLFDGILQTESRGWKVLHGELFKGEAYFGGYSFFTDGLLKSLTDVEGTFGMSEDLPFPGIFFHHPDGGTLLMAVLSQERCKPVWTLKRTGRAAHLTASEGWIGIPSIPVAAGGNFSTERWLLMHTPGDIPQAIDEYYKLLHKRFTFPGSNSILREAVVWGSCNYSTRPRGHNDITHDYIVQNAVALRRLIPRGPVFNMPDSGYQRNRMMCLGGECAGLDTFYPDSAQGNDPVFFPHGMKGASDAIRKADVRPAIWSSPFLGVDSELGKAHPDWLVKLKGKRQFDSRLGWLDYSLPEAREYTRACWNALFNEWGYDGLKLDFWTMQFEIPSLVYRNRDRTAIELRNLFLRDLREFVPPEGYLITCCTVNAGNPFIGRYADATRSSPDVGDGTWPEVIRSAQWQTASSLFYRGDAFLSQGDSFGWSSRCTRQENEAWATMVLVSGAVCEIGGDLTALSPEASQFLQTAVRHFGPRRRARSNFLDGLCAFPANHWTVETDRGLMEAWFNWMDYPRRIRLPGSVKDVWTGKTLRGDHLLQPHSAVLTVHGKGKT